ncbi:unnamed protein product [Rangifer tarandus platyrhynchus]|uniref:Uncharacterized protein n=1 Tax=Rangifer tarandus platyrhynchus TaxID=3082113 RepID=A0ABN8Z0P8_RANTA|nr:unnamed protein product [Rangifer tarandus platyrhynchus]
MPMHLLLPLPKTHPSPWLLGNPHLEVRTKHTEKASSLIALQTEFKVFFSGLLCAFLRILDHPAQTCDTPFPISFHSTLQHQTCSMVIIHSLSPLPEYKTRDVGLLYLLLLDSAWHIVGAQLVFSG